MKSKKLLISLFCILINISTVSAQYQDPGQQQAQGQTTALPSQESSAGGGVGGQFPGGEYYCGIDQFGNPALYYKQCDLAGNCVWVIVQGGVSACGGNVTVPVYPGVPPVVINGGASCTAQEINLTIDINFASTCTGAGCMVGTGVKVVCTGSLSRGYTCSIIATANNQQLGQVQVTADPLGAAQKFVIKCGDLVESVVEDIKEISKDIEIVQISPPSNPGHNHPEPGIGIGISIPFPWQKK